MGFAVPDLSSGRDGACGGRRQWYDDHARRPADMLPPPTSPAPYGRTLVNRLTEAYRSARLAVSGRRVRLGGDEEDIGETTSLVHRSRAGSESTARQAEGTV